MRIARVSTSTWLLNSFLSDMKAPAPLAAVDRQVVAFAEITGRLVPEIQDNAVFVRRTAFLVKDLAAFDIGERENQLRSRHRVSLSV